MTSSFEIESIEIRNFRPYRRARADFTGTDGHIHVIEGTQDAGKTSFHRAIQWGLYGGKGDTHNYKSNYNDNAMAEREEEMHVKMHLREPEGTHVLLRDIKQFNHARKKAVERLRITSGEDILQGKDAQEFINSRIPEDLKDFFFLDGERIRDLISEQRGREIKEEIEKVLKHTAILHARDDLQDLLDDRYRPKRDELERKSEERRDLKGQISDQRSLKRDLVQEERELKDQRKELKQSLSKARDLLDQRNKEASEELTNLEGKIKKLSGERLKLADELESAWEMLPLGILHSEIRSLCRDLKEAENESAEMISLLERDEVVDELVQTAEDGPCPICGAPKRDHVNIADGGSYKSEVSTPKEELQRRQVEARGRRTKLATAPDPGPSPSGIEEALSDTQNQIAQAEDDKDRLLDEYGGQINESEKGVLESSITDLRGEIKDLTAKIDSVQEEIGEIESEIDRLTRKKNEKPGSAELELVTRKITSAESALHALRDVREAHIQEKRRMIKEEMNAVFDAVSRSEFIRMRYQGIDFKGAAEEEDEYVVQLIKHDGTPKKMTNHKPSAGTTQLLALSFIFGLNQYARYSTTIVFDTVAGRLDSENSEGEGEFFSSLDESLILLLTDKEFEALGEGLQSDLGAHYRIRPDDDLNSELRRVN